ncbi:MAG: 3-deoxy-manno-octulosonate cytidylyltransferase [Gemmatimonadetes bacterium]|nr:3-deoxy-manno-octulosonate cytidylyltransferase [Gemmatimonadota bacterium]
MRTDPVLGVIPARLGSERLPRKPLRTLAGRPLIEWVWRRVSTFTGLDACVIATDADEVARVCRAFGADVVMTSPEHRSGTERVAEVVRAPRWSGFGIVVNVQGDEPFVRPDHIDAAVAEVRAGRDIGTIATPVVSRAVWHDPAVVKVVRRTDGAALCFSRAPIPFRRDGEPSPAQLAAAPWLRHIGVYAYSRDALFRWVTLPVNELEEIERLEQLRPLVAGLTIGVAIVAEAAPGVDTPDDLVRAERHLIETMEHGLSPIAER